MSFLGAGLGVGLAIVMLWAAVTLGSALARALVPDDTPPHLRTTATLLGTLWSLYVTFFVASAVGAFGRIGGASALLLGALIVVRKRSSGRRTSGWSDLRASLVDADLRGRAWTVTSMAVGLVALVRFGRATLKPPTATDALTYHLFHAGRYVQLGGWAVEPTPDAGGYYAYFPPLGDVLWAWVLLPAHGDALLGPGTFLVWGLAAWGAYAAGVAWGAPPRVATWGSVALVCTPAVLSWASSAYVDVLLLASFLLTMSWLPRAIERPTPRVLAIVVGGLAMTLGTKTPGVVVFGVTGLVLCVATVRRGSSPARTLGLLALAMIPAVPGLARGFLDHGNPLYPFGVTIAGVDVLPGNEELTLLHRGVFFEGRLPPQSLLDVLPKLVWPRWEWDIPQLNFGPAPILLLPLAIGARRWWGEGPGRRGATVVAGLVVVVFVARLAGDDSAGIRAIAAPALGRFLAIPYAVVVLAAMRSSPRWAVPVFGFVIGIGLFLSFPRGLGAVDMRALRCALPGLGLATLGCGAAWGLRSRLGATRALALAGALGGSALALTIAQRPALRSPYYASMYRLEIFDPHPSDTHAGQAWPIWQWVEAQPDGLRIAFAAGWNGQGHHWFRVPLLGSRLQHEVLYVPPTADGELVDYRLEAELIRRADRRAWLSRLWDEEIDLAVLCVPVAVEHRWALSMPDVFEPVVFGERRWGIAFRIHRDRLRGWLESL